MGRDGQRKRVTFNEELMRGCPRFKV
jgi:hypothetical protein